MHQPPDLGLLRSYATTCCQHQSPPAAQNADIEVKHDQCHQGASALGTEYLVLTSRFWSRFQRYSTPYNAEMKIRLTASISFLEFTALTSHTPSSKEETYTIGGFLERRVKRMSLWSRMRLEGWKGLHLNIVGQQDE